MENFSFLKNALKAEPAYKTLSSSVKNGRSLCASGLPLTGKAAVIYSLCRDKNTPALCISSDEKEAQSLCNDLCCMGLRAFVYPVRDYNFIDMNSRSREYEHERLKVLLKLCEGECDAVISCIDAACQLTVPQSVLSESTLTLEEGLEIPLEEVPGLQKHIIHACVLSGRPVTPTAGARTGPSGYPPGRPSDIPR